MDFSFEILVKVASFWGLELKSVGDASLIAGSPERTAFRTVVESKEGKLFVLENIHRRDFEKKNRIARNLAQLSRNGLKAVISYLPATNGEYVRFYEGDFWQLVPFIKGVALDRTTYYFEKWRSPLISQFLLALHQTASTLPAPETENVFNLKEYIIRILRQMERYHPKVRAELGPVVNFLKAEFMPFYEELPTAFCHGDYHPLNIIWGETSLLAVIDWEFSGVKPEIYDIANMVGCLGMENPDCLDGLLVVDFIRQMKETPLISAVSWKYFGAFVVALRFAWMSEWLRKNDVPMIGLELDYMNLLLGNGGKIFKTSD